MTKRKAKNGSNIDAPADSAESFPRKILFKSSKSSDE